MPMDHQRVDARNQDAGIESAWLAVSHGHALYFEVSGSLHGVPAVYLHGGPGAGMETTARSLFDPQRYRLVMFDQRGSGRSTPTGEIRHNTTPLLVEDIEALRIHLGVERWVVAGGSWGTTLALAYAQAHPERCLGLVLRGIFLATPSEIDWLAEGTPRFYPQAWARATQGMAGTTDLERLHQLHQAVLGDQPQAALAAALALARFEWIASSVTPDEAAIDRELTPEYTLPYQRVCCHYVTQGCFIDPDQLMAGMSRIHHLPGYIINGQFDAVCPPAAAYRLHQAWPGACLDIVPLAGHSASEPPIAAAVRSALDALWQGLDRTSRPDPPESLSCRP